MANDIMRLGHGWLLGPKRFSGKHMLDPFVINIRAGCIELCRSCKSFLYRTEKTYKLADSKVGSLRQLSKDEFAAVVSSEMGPNLPYTFIISEMQCFDLHFTNNNKPKYYVIIGRFNETVWNVHRILSSDIWPSYKEDSAEKVSLQALLGSASSQRSIKSSEEDGIRPESPSVMFTRLSMTMETVPEDSEA